MTETLITGIGVISSLGIGREAFWEQCRCARSGIRRITGFDTGGLQSNCAGCVEGFNPAAWLPPMTYRRMSRTSQMAVTASIEAVQDARLDFATLERSRVAVIMGTAYGGSSCIGEFFDGCIDEGPQGAHPFLFPETVPNAAASHIAIYHGITGPNCTLCQHDLSAEAALHYAANLIEQGHIDIALVGGSDELSRALLTCYGALGVLNDITVDATEPPVPRLQAGLVPGEGAAVLILEKSSTARTRGAQPYGILTAAVFAGAAGAPGYYAGSHAIMLQALERAVSQAAIDRSRIDQISVSANFSGALDRREYRLLTDFLKGCPRTPAIHPLKYLMGDFGGAGAVRAAALLLSMRRQERLPGLDVEILNTQGPFLPQWQQDCGAAARVSVMTSTNVGGATACLVFTAFDT